MSEPALLQVRGLSKRFPLRGGFFSRTRGWVSAVDDVSFEIRERETLGLVGESGSGKTTIGRMIVRLVEPTTGDVCFRGEEIVSLRGAALRGLRRQLQIVFQDPYGSLNPRWTVGASVEEGLIVHGIGTRTERRERVREAFARVGLDPADLGRHPHEFSGGQRQRVGIARALILGPRFIVCDEPVSALDVSVQAQILNLLEDLQAERGLSYLFISHDLAVVERVSHRVAVLLHGKIVESAPARELSRSPLHPYTQALYAAAPSLKRPMAATIPLSEASPSASAAATGCSFHPRCPIARDICRTVAPPLVDHAGHQVACHAVERKT